MILLGGLGTRLQPLTDSIPKPLLPLLDKPILCYQLELFREAGVKRLVLCLGYGSDKFQDFFSRNNGFGFEVVTIIEDEPLGTGGAIKAAYDAIKGENEVLIANGDVLSNTDLVAMRAGARADRAQVSISVFKVNDPSRFGLVKTDEDRKVTGFLEKTLEPGNPPYLINAGIYILDPSLLASAPEKEFISLERELFPQWIEEGVTVTAFEHRGYWRDIGTLTSYWRAHFEVLLHYSMYDPEFSARSEKGFRMFREYVYLENSVKLQGKASLERCVVLMRGCEVGEGARVARTVAMPFASIGEGAEVDDCILGPEVVIDPGEKVRELCITRDKRVPFETWED